MRKQLSARPRRVAPAHHLPPDRATARSRSRQLCLPWRNPTDSGCRARLRSWSGVSLPRPGVGDAMAQARRPASRNAGGLGRADHAHRRCAQFHSVRSVRHRAIGHRQPLVTWRSGRAACERRGRRRVKSGMRQLGGSGSERTPTATRECLSGSIARRLNGGRRGRPRGGRPQRVRRRRDAPPLRLCKGSPHGVG